MLFFFHTFFLFLVIQLYDCSQVHPQPVMLMDFEETNQNAYTDSLLSLKQVELSPDGGVDNTRGIRVRYIGNAHGSERVVRWFPLPYPMDEATLNFSVKFDENFKFVKGGKLHGFGPAHPVTGGNPIDPDGWSTRIMFKGNGNLISYIYHQKMPGKYGTGSASENPVFTPGKYNQVAVYTKINQPASQRNGRFEIWVDGQLVVSDNFLQLRGLDTAGSKINKFLFSTFHGGNSPEHAPKDSAGNYTIETAWFDNFEIYEGKHIKSYPGEE